MAIFDDGVDRGSVMPGILRSKEEPILHAEFCRSHRVFDEVVVNLDLAFVEVGLEAVPLTDGVAERFAEGVTGSVFFDEKFEDFGQARDDGATLTGTHCLSKPGAGFGFSQLRFDSVKLSHEVEDEPALPQGFAFVFLLFCGQVVVVKFSTNVREAAHEEDLGMVSFVCFVGGPTIALQDTGVVFADCFNERALTPADPPMIEEAAMGMVGEPEVATRGLSGAGFEIADRRFVNLQVSTSEGFNPDGGGDGKKAIDAAVESFEEKVSRDGDATTFEDFFLPIDGKMIAIFSDKEVRNQ